MLLFVPWPFEIDEGQINHCMFGPISAGVDRQMLRERAVLPVWQR
jgi:hypothetical protein